MDKNNKIKISDNTNKKTSGMADFSISYSSRKIDNAIISYEIISTLKAEDNIIIGINSSLLSLSENEKRTLNSQLRDSLERMGIKFIDKKTSVMASRSILSITVQSKKVEGFELFIYVPHDVWCEQELMKIIPKVGVSYYILKPNNESNLETFIKYDEDEKLEQCKMVIFDHILLGSMGINTSILKKDDIIELLNK